MSAMRSFLKFSVFALVFAGLGTAGYFWLEQYKTPLVREHAEAPLYTVGSPAKGDALHEGKPVLEWGPLPASAFYPGGLAFRTPAEALEWLVSSGKVQKNWRVYELSGDYNLDTHMVRGLPFTNKTLLISREIPTEMH
jgi:hypothetical protein